MNLLKNSTFKKGQKSYIVKQRWNYADTYYVLVCELVTNKGLTYSGPAVKVEGKRIDELINLKEIV